jgi:ribosomal protein L3 glutamine methyltransferase
LGFNVSSYSTLFASTEALLAAADVWCGHGYIDHHDEAIALVLASAGQPLDSDAGILNETYPEQARPTLERFIRQRTEERLPVAYIIGEAWLGPCRFRADARALVPRSPIAEIVLNELAPWWSSDTVPQHIVDVCCGGGSLGLLASHVFPDSRITLMDIDTRALALASENIKLHDKAEQVQSIRADLLSPLSPQCVDVILANPPYVDAPEMAVLPQEYLHEPRHALAAGEDGLDLVHVLLRQATEALKPGGLLLLEVGNSWETLEAAYPRFDFIWVELESGGYGVTALTREDLLRLAAKL